MSRRVLARPLSIFAIDLLATVASLAVAVSLRFEGRVPDRYLEVLPAALLLLLGSRAGVNLAFRLHRWCFGLAGLPDAVRVGRAGVIGSVAFVALTVALLPERLPRTIYALEFFLTTTALGALRFGPRVGRRWYRDRMCDRLGADRTVIVGANPMGQLLAKDVAASPDGRYRVVGFVAEEAKLVGSSVDGNPVLGTVRDLPEIIRRHRVGNVLLAIPREPVARLREILDVCATSRVRFKIVPASFTALEDRISAAALHDLAPEDLLSRDSVAFDQRGIAAALRGRRVLVTGASGSIGGEMCRQLVRHGVGQLVMVDMNENEMYLQARQLAEQAPGVEIFTEVADVREPERMERLGARFRPQYVFHAAAHKHVPLMEEAPEEAVKNNVFGTRNVARMADACGAERFVLISTDKAVNPTSVMGATKRVAELVVRDLARRSATRMTAVRFGNVLGSAGSVVPIFKQQIERGGPVTVTHPDCRRYFMTIPEAVGLVLAAGLGDHGDLCILDMGEPVRIEELARNMITLSGRVPGSEIPIVYTGLRPGEKLFEELLTEEEEQSHAVHDRIRTAISPPPPPDLDARLDQLERLAIVGDAPAMLRALQGLVPTYRRPEGQVAGAARERKPAQPPVAVADPEPVAEPVPVGGLATAPVGAAG